MMLNGRFLGQDCNFADNTRRQDSHPRTSGANMMPHLAAYWLSATQLELPLTTWLRRPLAITGSFAALLCSACTCSSSNSATTTATICDSCCIDVSDSAARSCEAVLETDTTQVTTFDKSIRGSSQQMGTKLAVAFTAREDKAFAGSLVNFSLSDGGGCSVKLTSSTCYDRLGKALEGATVNFRSVK